VTLGFTLVGIEVGWAFVRKTEPLLSIERLTKRYGDLVAVRDLSLEIAPGEIFAMLGPNGAGKTTLIGCVTGLIQHFDGTVRVAGYDVRRDYQVTRQVVGVVPQELNFDAFCSTRQILIYQGGYFGRRRACERADELLRIFGLSEKASANSRWLSGGMKRRLMICKALMHQPALLFLDEPTAGVDVELRDELWAYVRRLREEGVTVFLTTHYLEEAEQLADRIGILNQGRLILVDRRDRLLNRFGTRWLTVTCDRKLPKPLKDRLAPFQVTFPGPDCLRVRYRGARDPERVPVVEQVLAAVRDAGMQVRSLEGGRSSLEEIFRNIVKRDNHPDAGAVVEPEGGYVR